MRVMRFFVRVVISTLRWNLEASLHEVLSQLSKKKKNRFMILLLLTWVVGSTPTHLINAL